jgi:hypothetical protein
MRSPGVTFSQTLTLLVGVGTTLLAELAAAVTWWYTGGLQSALRRFRRRLDLGNDYTGWSIWLTNLVTPMYGQTDISGRLISFVVRLLQASVRTAAFACWTVGALALLATYVALPVLTLVTLTLELNLLGGSS